MKTPEQILIQTRGYEPLTDTVETKTAIKAMMEYGNQCYLQGMKLPQGLMSEDVYSEQAIMAAYNKGKSEQETLVQFLQPYKDMYEEIKKERDGWMAEYRAAREEVERLKLQLDKFIDIRNVTIATIGEDFLRRAKADGCDPFLSGQWNGDNDKPKSV